MDTKTHMYPYFCIPYEVLLTIYPRKMVEVVRYDQLIAEAAL